MVYFSLNLEALLSRICAINPPTNIDRAYQKWKVKANPKGHVNPLCLRVSVVRILFCYIADMDEWADNASEFVAALSVGTAKEFLGGMYLFRQSDYIGSDGI